jgi:predicted outer membrane protein
MIYNTYIKQNNGDRKMITTANEKMREEKIKIQKDFQKCMFGVEQIIHDDGVEVSRNLIHRTHTLENAQLQAECEHNSAMDNGDYNEAFKVVYTDNNYWR